MELYISYFGDVNFLINGQPIGHNLSEKAKGILAYITLNGTVHHRKTLQHIFWRDFEQKSANRNLRHAIWKIRNEVKKIDGSIDIIQNVSKSTIQMHNEVIIKTDVYDFKQTIEGRLNIDNETLRKFMSKYSHDFMENVYINNATEFNNWVYLEREDFKKQYFNYLFKVIENLKDRNEIELVREILKELIPLDPYNEQLYLELMKVYMENGNKGFAINVYKEMKKVLRSDLNVGPNKEINAYYRSIINNEDEQRKKEQEGNNHFEKLSMQENMNFKDCMADVLSNNKTISVIVTEKRDVNKQFKDFFVNHRRNKEFLELVRIPGRRVLYEGIFEFLDEFIYKFQGHKNIKELKQLIGYRRERMNEEKLYFSIQQYLNSNIIERCTLLIYDLSHIDEKTIDLLSYLYRKGALKNIKVIVLYNKNWETNRSKFFVEALDSEENVEILYNYK